MSTVNTMNKWMLGARAGEVVFVLPPPRQLSKADALLMAAWLVVLAEQEDGEFDRVLSAVKNT